MDSCHPNDILFRILLSGYFLYIQPLLYCFHMEYFLQDMFTGQTELRSSLLVNAVLGVAYMSIRSRK